MNMCRYMRRYVPQHVQSLMHKHVSGCVLELGSRCVRACSLSMRCVGHRKLADTHLCRHLCRHAYTHVCRRVCAGICDLRRNVLTQYTFGTHVCGHVCLHVGRRVCRHVCRPQVQTITSACSSRMHQSQFHRHWRVVAITFGPRLCGCPRHMKTHNNN